MQRVQRWRMLAGVLSLFVVGCTPPTAQQKMLGKWKGTPQVTEAVDQVVDAAAQGQKVNQLARGAARFLGNVLAQATLSVELDLRESGTAFFRGNTEALGLPSDSDGTWQVVSANPDIIQIRFSAAPTQLDAKVVFRDANEFTLKTELPSAPEPGSSGKVEKPVAVPGQEGATVQQDAPTGAIANENGTAAQPSTSSPAATSSPSDGTKPKSPPNARMVTIVFKRDNS